MRMIKHSFNEVESTAVFQFDNESIATKWRKEYLDNMRKQKATGVVTAPEKGKRTGYWYVQVTVHKTKAA